MGRYIIFAILFMAAFVANINPMHYIFDIGFTFGNLFLFIIGGIYAYKHVIGATILVYILSFVVRGFNPIQVIGLLEVLVVCYYYRKKGRKNLFINVLTYWCLFGLWGNMACYLLVGMKNNEMIFSLINLLINSLFNAFIAQIICYYWKVFRQRQEASMPTVSFSQIAFHIIMGTILAPFFITIITNGAQMQKVYQEDNYKQAQTVAKEVNKKIMSWSKLELQKFKLQGKVQVAHIQQIVDQYIGEEPIYLMISTDTNKVIMNSIPSIEEGIASDIEIMPIKEDFSYVEISKIRPVKIFSKELKGYYIFELPIIKSQLNIHIITPIDRYRIMVMEEYLTHFQIMSVFILFVLIAFWGLNRVLLNSINELVTLTDHLPSRLTTQEQIIWPMSRISEINLLVENFKSMYTELDKMFEMLQESKEELKELAYYDVLTGLANRLYFKEYLNNLVNSKAAGKVGVIFIDLNKFKQVNDELGHDVGDQLLMQVAARLRRLESYETKAFRLGGDEFVLIHQTIQKESIVALGKSANQIFEESFKLNQEMREITASIGVGIYPDHGNSIDQIVKRADEAMYHSKNRRDKSVYLYNVKKNK